MVYFKILGDHNCFLLISIKIIYNILNFLSKINNIVNIF
ncbi:unnamed protein product [Brugia timori]|uniref:Uncharacterized protein n=1 Tax=Brugia timori TaxID=42155 RepID=A0A0R3R6S7_9BILA|nr:unnamed protein product [Brugia timori]